MCLGCGCLMWWSLLWPQPTIEAKIEAKIGAKCKFPFLTFVNAHKIVCNVEVELIN